ncbi:MAG TPA: hypothetical protein VFW23_15355 [Tepidisphaeraceae bacterium]|nr:hypothetical protein [Tepidisphaeraceae bacterium]
MRCVARWMLNAMAVLSLLLCVATAVLWAVSYRQFIDVGQISTRLDATTYTQHLIRLGSNNGRFLFTRRDLMWPRPVIAYNVPNWEKENGWYLTRKQPFDLYRVFPRQPGDHSWHKDIAGVRFTRALELGGNSSRSMIGFVLIVPHAYVCAALVILPALRARRVLRRRRANRRGLCQTCFYDLKGNVSGVCPECGTAIDGDSARYSISA